MKRLGLADRLRDAINKSDETRYAIAKGAEIEQSVLSRFMAGDDIRLATADKLCEYLGLTLKQE